IYVCRRCGDLLDVVYDYDRLPAGLRAMWRRRPLSVWRYREILPVGDRSKVVTLGEGGTGLHRCPGLARAIGMRDLYVKNEGENPTGSFKDRGMTVGVTKALELRMGTVACASTGNTSASLSAYAAKASLDCIVIVPSGKVALGELAQAMVHGARIVAIRGNFDDALAIVRKLCSAYSVYLLNSINAFRLEGQKTLAMEVADQLGAAPDSIIVPVGNAGNISAIWKGLVELHRLGLLDALPRMIGIQAEGASPIVDAIRAGDAAITPVASPETIATAIRIGRPVNWKKAMRAIRESGGLAEKVSDGEIVEAQSLLARTEGLFVEPASAASIAGLRKLVALGAVEEDERVVCVTTGHGLMDIGTVIGRFPPIEEVEASLESVRACLADPFVRAAFSFGDGFGRAKAR
ncbi:TPA: threonine synthase, partial [Candidatus Bathyarchaeota archaeon]|nr:threonine synthase [Candidatus Bathyarchaeota archaeon]